MTRNAVFHDAGAFDDGAPITSFPGAIVSVFGRTGTVIATAGDYYAVLPAALTGATQAFRIAGATTSGAPVSGTFAVGDLVAARDGHLFMCISAGTPGTWVDTGGSVSFATPAIVLGASAAAGSAGTAIRSDSTIAAFDATAPSTQAFGDAAAVGTAAFAARRDHKHGMPAAPDVAADIHAASSKTTPIDADEYALVDTAASNVLKKLTGTNLKAYLKAYFDTLYSGSATSRKTYLNKPAGNITRAATSVGAFSTAWQITGVVVASGQNVMLVMSCNSIASTATADQLLAFFRDSTQIAARTYTSSGSSAHNGRQMTWIDENPGAGTYTYEIRAAMFTSGTLTVYQSNPTTDIGQGSAVFIAEVYTP